MKKHKPTTPGRRNATKEDFSMLTKKKPEKGLIKMLKKSPGRNNQGRITVRHKSRGAKKFYRIISFGQEKINQPAKVIALEYDPYRTSFIMLLEYSDGSKAYRLAPQGVKVGEELIIAPEAPLKSGNRMRLENIPIGTEVYNIELVPDGKGKLVKTAGSSAKVLGQEGNYMHLKMPSGELRKVHKKCFASVGALSRPDHRYVKLGKAGKNRHKGVRPAVRGSAMTPRDHPHGGGEGRTGIGLKHPKTPWGKIARGVKTRKRKNTDKFILQRRKKK